MAEPRKRSIGSTKGAICPYCSHQHEERTAWGAGEYEQTCRKCGREFDLTIKVVRRYVSSQLEPAPDA